MPIYEFLCQKCGAESELLIRTSRWKGTPCPECGSTKLAKKLSVFASSVAGAKSEPASCGGGGGGQGCCGKCHGGGHHCH
jgi:putative FmdB family regulatory protein